MAYTPMLEQYLEIKQQHPDEILFFRLGDFYEMFFTDAELAAKELEIALTARDGGLEQRIPMCGVPYHAADNYIAKLIAKGYKVAICEQVEDPKQAKGIVRREVIKIITSGTLTQEAMLSSNGNNYLVALYEEESSLALTAADISTGECIWAIFNGTDRASACLDHIYRLMPAEIVFASQVTEEENIRAYCNDRLECCTYTKFDSQAHTLLDLLDQHFTKSQQPDSPVAKTAVAALLGYLHYNLKSSCAHLNSLTKYELSEHLILDASTLRNLEITRNMREGGKRGTLLGVLDFTKTAMGSRLLKKWLEYPLINSSQIAARQDAIETLLNQAAFRAELTQCLEPIYDFERIVTRIEIGTANARDLKALHGSLQMLPAVKKLLSPIDDKLLQQIYSKLGIHEDITELLGNALLDEAPFSVREGGMIRQGYNSQLDSLRSLAKDNKQWIQDVEAHEREATGIKSLKVGYNKVFGYYIEVTHAQTHAVPPTYVRKQTLANAERYITPELKEYETKVLGAQEKIVALEYQLFCELRDNVKTHIPQIQQTARQIAALDCLISLTEAAARYNYIRPALCSQKQIVIKDGRHPVVEQLLKGEMFVPNDTQLNHHSHELIILTGPNMAGKSTYMRQVALLALMAQVGSFIPAAAASLHPVDRIFTRVGASDDLATGQSTFMVEMSEVAHILKNATRNSLVILDEIGRGTSTFDGMSIAQAVIEYIGQRTQSLTLFATHYHELIALADNSPKMKNYSVAVKERGKQVLFLRRIIAGGADRSYGIHVAQLAGLLKTLIDRATALLAAIEQCEPTITMPVRDDNEIKAKNQTAATALSLFSSAVIDKLLSVDVMTLTPIEALNLIYQLQNQAKEETGA